MPSMSSVGRQRRSESPLPTPTCPSLAEMWKWPSPCSETSLQTRPITSSLAKNWQTFISITKRINGCILGAIGRNQLLTDSFVFCFFADEEDNFSSQGFKQRDDIKSILFQRTLWQAAQCWNSSVTGRCLHEYPGGVFMLNIQSRSNFFISF